MKPALLVVDMQNDFFKKEELLRQKDLLVANINNLAEICRNKKIPVIWVKQVLKADLSNSPKHIQKSGKGEVLEGTPGSELLEGLHREDGDLEVIKTRYSAFFKTKLEEILAPLGVDTIIVCGINTHACVRMTAIDAYERDYSVIVAKDCVGSWDNEHHQITMKYFEPTIAKVLTNQEIEALQLD